MASLNGLSKQIDSFNGTGLPTFGLVGKSIVLMCLNPRLVGQVFRLLVVEQRFYRPTS